MREGPMHSMAATLVVTALLLALAVGGAIWLGSL